MFILENVQAKRLCFASQLMEKKFFFFGSAVLAHFILKERLQKMGVLGCVLCIVGSTVIVLHAPEERTLSSMEQIWKLATQPGIFCIFFVECFLLFFMLLKGY